MEQGYISKISSHISKGQNQRSLEELGTTIQIVTQLESKQAWQIISDHRLKLHDIARTNSNHRQFNLNVWIGASDSSYYEVDGRNKK